MRLLLPILLILQLGTALHAAQTPKLKLLYIQMKHCPWCHKMNKEIFENPKIARKLKSMYIIESKMRGAENLPDFVQPKYYPTTYILSTDGERLLDELPGYMEPKHFMEYLEELYALETSSE